MAYNLPNAWDSGYVLPKNVQDEGLERRAFITKYMPRGTYDNPSVGTGGYAVPKYVMDEGYGQGTFTTKWQPSGSYAGPKIPNWLNQRPQVVKESRLPGGAKVVTVQSLGADDAPIHPLYEDYGARAAQIILNAVGQVPAKIRPQVLKNYLTKLDKSLWKRTQDIWKRYVSQGANPAQAFPLALARALSAGIAAEIVDTGLRRSAPQANSLLGLGCYRRPALGALGLVRTGGPLVGSRTTGATPPMTRPEGSSVIVTYTAPPMLLDVGGFRFPKEMPINTWSGTGQTGPGINSRMTPASILVTKPGDLTPDQADFLMHLLTDDKDSNGKQDTRVPYNLDSEAYGFRAPDDEFWFSRLGISQEMQVRLHVLAALKTARSPVAWGSHPDTGEALAVHMRLFRLDPLKEWDAATNPTVLKVWLSRIPDPGFWASVGPTIHKVGLFFMKADLTGLTTAVTTAVGEGGVAIHDAGEKIRDAVHDILKDLTCDVLQSPAGGVAGAGAAMYVGAPPQAGIEGAKIGAQMCGGGQVAPPAPVATPGSSLLPLAILAGGAVVAIAVFSKRKKKS